jgi:hypothetical protein
MKTFVSYNCGANATTASGRLRNGVIPNFSIATDLARGDTISWTNAWKPVLKDLQEIANAFQVDFSVNKTGAASWSFEVYPSQLGTDRTTELLFSLENGNMTDPQYSYNVLNEKTVALAAGEGEKATRQIVVASGVNYSATNDREIFTDARNNQSSLSVLAAAAQSTLRDNIPTEEFSFSVLQTPASYYGVHYFLGDLVRSQYKGRLFIQKIEQIQVRYTRQGLEQITVQMRTR